MFVSEFKIGFCRLYIKCLSWHQVPAIMAKGKVESLFWRKNDHQSELSCWLFLFCLSGFFFSVCLASLHTCILYKCQLSPCTCKITRVPPASYRAAKTKDLSFTLLKMVAAKGRSTFLLLLVCLPISSKLNRLYWKSGSQEKNGHFVPALSYTVFSALIWT